MNETSEEGPFLDLASYKQVDMPIHTRGNIIKAARVTSVGSEKVGVIASGQDDPVVVLHKEGERVVCAEFICKCGRSTMLHLDYEQE